MSGYTLGKGERERERLVHLIGCYNSDGWICMLDHCSL